MVFWAPPPEQKKPCSWGVCAGVPPAPPCPNIFISSRLLCRMYIYYRKSNSPPPLPSLPPGGGPGVCQNLAKCWRVGPQCAVQGKSSTHTWVLGGKREEIKIFSRKIRKTFPNPLPPLWWAHCGFWPWVSKHSFSGGPTKISGIRPSTSPGLRGVC